ncbi:hypothetical protein KC19_1G102600 [Ceratodon purpureus]|uniref:Uncharacterized protein n=1 Tax=Ceratodon purpureus TaxID=3225 RepID=A0A8T0J6E5_CERPU|nr:hypothetical protein KC19_1G102600 [Ceratodon purpureus]
MYWNLYLKAASLIGIFGVEDVALAHLLVYENPKSEGRYICNERVLHYGDFVSLLSKLYPQYPVVAKDADDSPRIPAHELSNEKLKNLGLTFRSLEEVVHETVACLKELNINSETSRCLHLIWFVVCVLIWSPNRVFPSRQCGLWLLNEVLLQCGACLELVGATAAACGELKIRPTPSLQGQT